MTTTAFRRYAHDGTPQGATRPSRGDRGDRRGDVPADGRRGDIHAGGAVRSVRPGQSVPSPERAYVPPGWPEEVLPPGVDDWEASAVAWLLDQCPADYRGHQVLRRHPVVLARFAAQFVEGQIRSSREALATARASLGEYVDNDVLDRATQAIQAEGARLVRTRRAVMLVEESLRGRIFLRKL